MGQLTHISQEISFEKCGHRPNVCLGHVNDAFVLCNMAAMLEQNCLI